jgi:hypothetical protein
VSDKYILVGHTVVPCPWLLRWATWMETADRVVARTEHELFVVSTVFLGLDHSFRQSGPPILFETMAFHKTDDGKLGEDFEQQRYANWEDAELGHHAMVRRLAERARRAVDVR